MSKVRTDSDPTTHILKVFEGFRGSAYRDAVGYGTIGYGHLLTPKDNELASKTLTKEEAENLLQEDIAAHKKGSISQLTKDINHNKMAALTSLAFNHGPSSAPVAKIVNMINSGEDDHAIAKEFLRYNTADGKVLSALEDRRQIESDLFLTPEGGEVDLSGYGKKKYRAPLPKAGSGAEKSAPLIPQERLPLETTPLSLPPGKMSLARSTSWVIRLWIKIRTFLG